MAQTIFMLSQGRRISPKPLTGTPIITVHQGKEPITFTGFFLGWDDEFWDTDVSDKLQYSQENAE